MGKSHKGCWHPRGLILAIVAESFGRLFFRSSISGGLLVAVCPEFVGAVDNGDRIEVDTVSGQVKNLTSDRTLSCTPLPAILNEMVECGGEKPYLKARLARDGIVN